MVQLCSRCWSEVTFHCNFQFNVGPHPSSEGRSGILVLTAQYCRLGISLCIAWHGLLSSDWDWSRGRLQPLPAQPVSNPVNTEDNILQNYNKIIRYLEIIISTINNIIKYLPSPQRRWGIEFNYDIFALCQLFSKEGKLLNIILRDFLRQTLSRTSHYKVKIYLSARSR